MTIVIEVDSKEARQEVESFLEGKADMKKVEEYDLGLKLSKDVSDIKVLLNEIIDKGVSKNLLLYYLKGKGYSLAEVNRLLSDLDSFLKELGIRK